MFDISPSAAGSETHNLLKFLYDLRELSNLQERAIQNKILSEDEAELHNESIAVTKDIADDFLMVAPILLYRLIEKYLKQYLLNLYKPILAKESDYTFKKSSLTFSQAIMTADILRIEALYNNPPINVEMTKLPGYDIITEIRELNNCLKHNHDLVSDKLNAANPSWVVNNIITVENIGERISKYDEAVNSFFHALVINAFK
ncbi:hypothetical protein K3G39_20155 [Pontibacter sp. HSC-14F20]|uniref:hypothetical protein n=1 Tax=Pontibacter sp. HSC-14F20 TaxID=2864136 RepID=UPI001C733D79|nr:hypothetical protein [Pontibacter sp. HSC-14F20]MBX0335551.1 hypothetical protein [Pontibacter sp. HSC-14F20]